MGEGEGEGREGGRKEDRKHKHREDWRSLETKGIQEKNREEYSKENEDINTKKRGSGNTRRSAKE